MDRQMMDRNKNREAASGATLVEIVVVLAISGLIFSLTSAVLGLGLRMHLRMMTVSQARYVADQILDKIASEIAMAKLPSDGTEGYYFCLADDETSKWAAFQNQKGIPAAIYARTEVQDPVILSDTELENDLEKLKDGQIYIRRYRSDAMEHGSNAEESGLFDDDFYMGFKVTALNFSREDPIQHPNVLRIDLSITDSRTGISYDAYRYAEIYEGDMAAEFICVSGAGSKYPPEDASDFRIPEGGDIPLISDIPLK